MPEKRLQKARESYCDHVVMKVEGPMGISQICIKCGKTIYIDKTENK